MLYFDLIHFIAAITTVVCLDFDLICMEKGPDPRTAKREFHAAEARCCFVP